jgi:hypothetical protein
MRTKQTVDVLNITALTLAGLVVMGFQSAGAAESRAPTATLKVGTNAIPQSVFVDDERGRDPFFPNSTRRQHKPAVPELIPTVGPASLVLRGITGPPERRIALINNQTFLAGEEAKVRVPGGSSLVKCEEIRERSVVVTIQGGTERFEIHLLERTLPIAPEGQGSEQKGIIVEDTEQDW